MLNLLSDIVSASVTVASPKQGVGKHNKLEPIRWFSVQTTHAVGMELLKRRQHEFMRTAWKHICKWTQKLTGPWSELKSPSK